MMYRNPTNDLHKVTSVVSMQSQQKTKPTWLYKKMVSQRRFFFFPYLIFHHRLPNSNYGIPALLRSKFCSIHPPLLRSILFRLLRHYRFFESSPASSEKRTRKKKRRNISSNERVLSLSRLYDSRQDVRRKLILCVRAQNGTRRWGTCTTNLVQ